MMELQDPLKPRELEVLRLMADGLTNREIGEQLYIGVETVRWYAKQIYSKMDVGGREEASQKASELGLLDGDASQLMQGIKHNLPVQMTAFIGRETELRELADMLDDPQKRLVTILAPGGMGKTRLALELAKNFVGERHASPLQDNNYFSDGVFFVPLQPLSDPAQIVTQIATSIDFRFVPDQRDPKQQLLDFIAKKQMLLVIDNWEHLIAGAPLVNELLQAAPQVKIIATSREKLNLSGETVYALSGMQFPQWETPGDALEYDAVKLLVQSAQRVKSDWDVTQQNLDHVARVCRLTQGMPLGIVLAASWLDVLTLDRITTEIQKSLDFLETELRDIPERQRSIRAVFDWTWQQLKPDERDVFMKLSVFRGGFTVEAAEKVAGATIRNLQSFVNKALLVRDKAGRFDAHELLRQFGENELAQSSEIEHQTRDKHAALFAEFVADYVRRYYGSDPIPVMQEGKNEYDNILVAWEWAFTNYDSELLLNMASGMGKIFYNHNRLQEGTELLAYSIQFLDRSTNSAQYHEITALLAAYCAWLGSYHIGEDQLARMVERASAFFDRLDINQASDAILEGYHIFGCAVRHSQPDRAQAIFEAIRVLLREGQSQIILRAESAWQWAFTQVHGLGKTDGARDKLEDAMTDYQQINSYYGIATTQVLLSGVFYLEVHYDEARHLLEAGIKRFEAMGEQYNLLASYVALVEIEIEQNNLNEASNLLSKGLALCTDIGWTRNTQFYISAVAKWLVANDEPLQALQLVAFSEYDLPFIPIAPATNNLDHLRNELRATLSSKDYAAAVERGRALDWEAVLERLEMILKLGHEI